jgi:hypothetical protein
MSRPSAESGPIADVHLFHGDRTVCTIVTGDWVPRALALYDSLRAREPAISFTLLIAEDHFDATRITRRFPNIEVLLTRDVCHDGAGKRTYQRYFHSQRDNFRWSMKSVLIDFLLTRRGYERVLYLDPDFYCFSDFSFLFEKLSDRAVLLSPHWRPLDPPKLDGPNGPDRSRRYCKSFLNNFSDGFFNAGLVGSSTRGARAMQWWADACAYRCEQGGDQGLYDDQRYLDLIAVRFEDVEALEHRGCNIACWNRDECRRTASRGNGVMINDRWEVVFVHFTPATLRGIDEGRDPLLEPLLDEYRAAVQRFSDSLQVEAALGVAGAAEARRPASAG